MVKKGRSRSLLIIGVFTLLAVGSWAGFDIYRALTNTTLTEVQQRQILPLKIDVGDELVQSLRQRKKYDELYLDGVISRPVPGDQTIVQTEEMASPSGEVTEVAEVEIESGVVATDEASVNPQR